MNESRFAKITDIIEMNLSFSLQLIILTVSLVYVVINMCSKFINDMHLCNYKLLPKVLPALPWNKK